MHISSKYPVLGKKHGWKSEEVPIISNENMIRVSKFAFAFAALEHSQICTLCYFYVCMYHMTSRISVFVFQHNFGHYERFFI